MTTYSECKRKVKRFAKERAEQVHAGHEDGMQMPLRLRDFIRAEFDAPCWNACLHTAGMLAYRHHVKRLAREAVA